MIAIPEAPPLTRRELSCLRMHPGEASDFYEDSKGRYRCRRCRDKYNGTRACRRKTPQRPAKKAIETEPSTDFEVTPELITHARYEMELDLVLRKRAAAFESARGELRAILERRPTYRERVAFLAPRIDEEYLPRSSA